MVADLHAKRWLIAILRGIPASDTAEVAHAMVDCRITSIEAPLN
jgi:hypothetical protein